MPNLVLEHLEQWVRIRSGRAGTSQTRRLRDERQRINRRRAMKRVVSVVDEFGARSIAELVNAHSLSYEDIKLCIEQGLISDCGRNRYVSCLHVTYDGDQFLERKQSGT